MTRPKRILLDSNVWRYIVDAGSLPNFQRAARASKHKILVAPAVLYEAAHTARQDVRDALLSAMSLPLWKRLMPEAYSESEELKAEVTRLRPEWLRQAPDLSVFNRVRHDWTRARGGLWDRIKADAELLQRFDVVTRAQARQQAQDLRTDALKWPAAWRDMPLTGVTMSPSFSIVGWGNASFEPWRFVAFNAFRTSMAAQGHAAIDWLGGEIDLELMLFQLRSLTQFWLGEVETARMPRHWLRWAFEFLQQQHKVSDGTPVDTQIGTYLLDADLMLSADRVFVRIANRVREDAPFPVAHSRAVPGGAQAVEAVLDEVTSE